MEQVKEFDELDKMMLYCIDNIEKWIPAEEVEEEPEKFTCYCCNKEVEEVSSYCYDCNEDICERCQCPGYSDEDQYRYCYKCANPKTKKWKCCRVCDEKNNV